MSIVVSSRMWKIPGCHESPLAISAKSSVSRSSLRLNTSVTSTKSRKRMAQTVVLPTLPLPTTAIFAPCIAGMKTTSHLCQPRRAASSSCDIRRHRSSLSKCCQDSAQNIRQPGSTILFGPLGQSLDSQIHACQQGVERQLLARTFVKQYRSPGLELLASAPDHHGQRHAR